MNKQTKKPKQVTPKELLNRKNLGLFQGDHHFKGIDNKNINLSLWEYEAQKYSIDNVHDLIKEYKPKHYFSLGDVFNEVPPRNTEQELFDKLFGNIPKRVKIHMIQGNHSAVSNSTTREYYKDNLKEWYKEKYNINLYGYEETDLGLMCSHKYINKLEHLDKEYPLVFSHFRSSEGNAYYSNEISLVSLRQNAQAVICGDIHKRLAFDNIIYTGSSWQSHFPQLQEGDLPEKEKPSVLILDLDTLEYSWLDTIGENYQKKSKQYFLIEDFLADVKNLEQEHLNKNTFFKIHLSDTKMNLQKFKQQEKDFKFCIFKTEAIDLIKETNILGGGSVKELFSKEEDKTLVQESVSKNLLEYIHKTNKEKKYEDLLNSTYATLESNL